MQNARFTLDDFLSMKGCEKMLLLTLNRPELEIMHISANEAPAGEFIRSGELVLTTATGCREPDSMLAFIRDLHLNGAVAVAITFENTDHTGVPQCVIDYANSVGMPIIWLPWSYRFADIVERVLGRIRFVRNVVLDDLESLRRRLFNAYLEHEDLAKVIGLVAAELGVRAVLTDTADSVLVDSAHKLKQYQSITAKQRTALRQFAFVGVPNRDLGILYLAQDAATQDRIESMRDYSAYITMPLALWLEQNELVRATRAGRIDEYLIELAEKGFVGSDEAFSKARYIGLHPNDMYTCLVGRVSVKDGNTGAWLKKHSGTMNALLPNLWPGRLITLRASHILAFTSNITDAAAMAFRLSERLRASRPELIVDWGASEAGTAADFPAMYADARIAASLHSISPMSEPVFLKKDTDAYRILQGGFASEAARSIIQRRLGALIKYDGDRGANLMGTLQCYLSNGCNAAKAARELHLHRQSMRYRLAKIHELTETATDTHGGTFVLELCLLAHSYSKLSLYE